MIFISVFLTSLSAIAFEILLTRVFSISQWHHLSFMVISLSLFGLAASGTFLSFADSLNSRFSYTMLGRPRLVLLNAFYALSALFSFLLVIHIPLDYFKLPIQPLQALYLMIAYIALAAPFFFAGLIISCAYASRPETAGQIYFMNMSGSALGALIPAMLLSQIDEGRLIALLAMLPLLVCLFFPIRTGAHENKRPLVKRVASICSKIVQRRIKQYLLPVLIASLLIAAGMWILRPNNPLLQITFSDYKALYQLLQFPNAEVISTTTGIRGRIDTVRSPFIRFAPGISIKYPGAMPPQFAVYKDGDGKLVCYDGYEKEGFSFAKHLLSYSGYKLLTMPKKVLIIQNGGGIAIPCALSSGSSDITVIERQPEFSKMIERHYPMLSIRQHPRIYLALTADRFDVMQIEDWGTSLPGTSSLLQGSLFTEEAFISYFERISDRGVIIVSRKLILPPSNMIRLGATIYEALKSSQVAHPQDHMIILRNWDTFTCLVLKKPLPDIAPIRMFALEHNFDMVWPQTKGSNSLNRFNKFDQPYHYKAIHAMFEAYTKKKENTFFKTYPLDVSPQTDNRPYPDKFFRWCEIKSIHAMTGERLYTLLMSGEIIIGVVFLEALFIACFLLIIPLLILDKRRTNPVFLNMVYFICIGTGFILFELFFINVYTRILEDPVLSFSLVLAAIMVFSSTGGLLTTYLKPKTIKKSIFILSVLISLMGLTIQPMLEAVEKWPFPACVLASIILLAPAGLLLGLPFPMGMRYLLKSPVHRAYAWATNGCASVLSAIVAAQIAISSGLNTLLWCAAATYFIAWLTASARYRTSL